MRGIILSAGLGTRMGDMSKRTPKPLVYVAGRTLLDRALDRTDEAGFDCVVVNVHHHADQLEAHLARRIDAGQVVISDERDKLLDTGGGVKKALPLLGKHPFFTINSDALWLDGAGSALLRLASAFDADRMDALLLLIPTPDALGYDGVGDFIPFADGMGPMPIDFRGEAPVAPVMYGGIQMIASSLYDNTPDGAWSNRVVFRKAAAAGRLFGLVHDGHWMHVGTPEGVTDAEARLKELGAP
ncbi:nucleotidyltransferase family protein [Kordiimonas aestuarii]|uniref:nucleotidyltransferase family protein n=1 Tax=Kordiimonas aestuarii TaxID=1005925 RepID=UPI0021D0D888|nr:nucleotidyltransferase family protein [Kordiimonas aestuarii]